MQSQVEQSLKIAIALEKLVEKSIVDFELGLDVLRVPTSIRKPMWEAMARYATAKAMECK